MKKKLTLLTICLAVGLGIVYADKISEYSALAGSGVDASADLIPISDISATETKNITPAELKIAMGLVTSAGIAGNVSNETGTSLLVFNTSPTLVTPLLGTPTSGVLTNCTGLPVSSGISGLGTGVATALATPTSANLATAITNETGSSLLVFNTSPTLVTPLLGTPTSGTLTNCTGLPISTGVSGLGTGVATALATPSSANLAAAVSDETGTGLAVFATSPTLTTPILGVAAATSVTASGLIKSTSATAGIGYATGAGGAVTQITSKSTGVTLNTVSGQITLNNASLGATTSISFTLTDSAIAAIDTVSANIASGATVDSYTLDVTAVAAGSCRIQLRNFTAGSLAEAIVINFNVIKGASS